ncbi:MAG: GntR family transcriptional regulator [Mycobacteriales bacterium]
MAVHSPPGRGAALRPATPETLVEYVTEQVRNRIILGVLKPGERVPLYALADEFGISRVPLREGLRQLEAEGLVDNVPRRGTVVRDLSRRDLVDAFDMLATIEVIAAERAAQAADEDTLERMREASQRMRRYGHDRVSAEMLHAHRDFHFAFFDRAGPGILLHHLRMLWHTCERYVMHGMPEPKRQESSRREHLELLRCIEKGEAEAAAEVLRHHLQASLDFALSRLPPSETAARGR